jgi:DNA-binding response OmpR family regulator
MADETPTVLVVEDDRDLSELIGAYAEICGLRYRHAYNGQSAIAAARQAPTPRAVILDLMLPDIDGFEVCRQLRAGDQTSSTPVIILSALGSEEARRRGREAGANQHLTKPFDPDEFMRVLSSHLNAQPPG